MGTIIFAALVIGLLVFIGVKQLAHVLNSQGILIAPWVQLLLFVVIMLCFFLVPFTAPDMSAAFR